MARHTYGCVSNLNGYFPGLLFQKRKYLIPEKMDFHHSQNISLHQRVVKFLQKILFLFSLTGVLIVLFDVGFSHSAAEKDLLQKFYFGILLVGLISISFRYIFQAQKIGLKVRIFDTVLFILLSILLLMKNDYLRESLSLLDFFNKMGWVFLALLLFFIREFSALKFDFKREYLNPAQLFITSFLIIIFFGTLLLLLPKATHSEISIVDAIFTATSAVCVTGLIVEDTGSFFTPFGQTIIMVLIQLGGLGIMTFASYFSYFFRGNTTYKNQIMLKDISNSEKIGEVFGVLKKILLVTFAIEVIGAFLIYFTTSSKLFSNFYEHVFFSVFHSISGFCNAGFSTLENSLFEPGFRFNYPLQLIIALLFILGGIGFPILFNLFKYSRSLFIRKVTKFRAKKSIYSPWVLTLNSRIILSTTAVLLFFGSILFYIFEANNTLAEHHGLGKVVTAFFGAATPRTAGFNSVDTSALNFSTTMIIFLLMWIGASPASTGGGIKTSTFAIATLNFFSLARGKDRIEIFKREIAGISIRRAFAIISLSLLVIGTSIFLISTFDNEKSLLNIAFETFSAYSTVGLSLGITSSLSSASKLVIVATMFIGRVSMLTMMIAILRNVKHLNYRYPTEEILIN